MIKKFYTNYWVLIPFLTLFGLTTACAQSLELVKEENRHHSIYEVQTQKNEAQMLTFEDSFTSVVLKLKKKGNFQGVFLIDNKDTIDVDKAQHRNSEGSILKSELIMLTNRSNQFQILTKGRKLKLTIHLLDASKKGYKPQPNPEKRGRKNCERPQTIPQNDWREGLQEPDYTPKQHTVKHVIVHHSAGNTQNADTRSVVRNIYLQHTQVNGWSDIGYNFLIGINGQPFEGRDGMGMIPDNQVKGAHFCGKNTNTMGVCLIGNYEDNPTNKEALASLKDLMTWKMKEADLDPAAFYKHPDYANNPDFLGTIAGHKDGCATLCPGKNLYGKIDKIKADVNDSLSECASFTGINEKGNEPSIFLEDQRLAIQGLSGSNNTKVSLFNLRGRQVVPTREVNPATNTARITLNQQLEAGIYLVQLRNDQGKIWTQKVRVS